MLKIDLNEVRLQQIKKLPSPSTHVDEKRPFTMDKIVQKMANDSRSVSPPQEIASARGGMKTKTLKMAPGVALANAKLKRVSNPS